MSRRSRSARSAQRAALAASQAAQPRAAPADLARRGPAGRRPGRAPRARPPRPRLPPPAPRRHRPVSSGPALGPSGGWAIPYAIVLCESGGQNLPPNSAGASGYYQIIPSTWKLFGGTGPAAYLASKSEQDAVASRIWNGGAGASNWVCAGIVGIH